VNAPAQGTVEWLAARAGHCTASRFKDVLAQIKAGEAATRRNYRMQLVTERLTGLPQEGYQNAAMQWGTDTEPFAREAYEIETGDVVQQTGFLSHRILPWVGCSPDGLLGEDGGIEIKCPHQSVIHVETLQGGMPTEHRAQVQGSMWVTGRKRWIFCSFDPRMPERLRLHIEEVKRDDEYIAKLEKEVRTFLSEVEKLTASLMQR
jgi:putative phage-type endonuclease